MKAKVKMYALVVLGLLLALLIVTSCENTAYEAPLFDNLGAYQVDITTNNQAARKFFNQGLLLANGFNHLEAARSFREALRQDSTCAMAYWGIAYVLGPNINTSSSLGERSEISNALKGAQKYREQASYWEQYLLDAIRSRFPEDAATVDGEAYAHKLKQAAKAFPENDLILTLYAESMMNLHAWDFYTYKGGKAKAWTPEIVTVLEKALQINPQNPLANHLYIHAVEAAPDVEKGLKSAERLASLVPGAGHLVHMPSHIYINTGDYHLGSLANEQAIKADSSYIAECQAKGVYPQLYYPHNYHFLAATAALEGRGARSIEASFKMAEIIDRNYLEKPGFETTQHYITIPYNVLVKFAQWEKILALPEPELIYPKAISHYARGMAFTNTGQLNRALRELSLLIELKDHEEVEKIHIFEVNFGKAVTNIAVHVLAGEIARVQGSYADAIVSFRKAIELEDQLNYNEPPDWFFSVRHLLGDVYLVQGQFEDAEKIFREDLFNFPKNGFALNGLYHSLLGQDRPIDAEKVQGEFEKAWQYADTELKYARVHPENRENLALNITSSSATDLMYIASAFCGQ